MEVKTLERLVDPRFGLIRRLHDVPPASGMPRALRHAHASVASSQAFCPWPSDDRAAGFAWNDQHQARAAAVGEAVERLCGNIPCRPLRRSSWRRLSDGGESAIDPASLSLFHPRQYAQPGFPFRPFDAELEVLWTAGYKLRTKTASPAPTWVPASLVWVTFHQAHPTHKEPKISATPYAGVATAKDRRAAETAALLEVVERDAFSLGWYRGDPVDRVEIPPDLLAQFTESRDLEIQLLSFPSLLQLPVIGALVTDRRRGHRALGVACRFHPREAALKAAAEACQLLLTVRLLDDPHSPFMQAVGLGSPGIGIKPWRRDRAYLSLYRQDWQDSWDLLCNLQLHLDPRLGERLDERLDGGQQLRLADLPELKTGPSPRDDLVARFHQVGLDPVAVDLTTPDVRATGLEVVRIVVPGLYGNAPAAFPYLGGARMAESTAEGSTCPFPPPYA